MRVMWIHEDIDQAKPFYLDSDDCELVILKHWTITCELCKENIVAWIIWGIYMHIYQSKHMVLHDTWCFPRRLDKIIPIGKDNISLLDPPLIWIHLPPNHKSLGTLGKKL